ncbi:E3 SUMO-protein ligase ZBED1-like [Nilaparvata lugens]|uniref:E3 SUMO-protein ligase ZBED1-like n=1 Tax=Nilaparvata lugens TaxID=108931 RepID=UPI00193D55FE|nr:E3 SUMO-protein ligase ZBED1-like [Nilaparvata lugens]
MYARNQPKGQPRMPSCGHTKSASYKCDQLSRRDIEHFHRIIYAKLDKIYQDSMMLKYCSVSAPKRSRVEKVGSSRKDCEGHELSFTIPDRSDLESSDEEDSTQEGQIISQSKLRSKTVEAENEGESTHQLENLQESTPQPGPSHQQGRSTQKRAVIWKKKNLDHQIKETTTTSSKNDDAIDEPDVNLPSTSGCTGNAVPDQKHQNIRNPITESYEKIASLKEGGDRHSTITLCILFFICKDMRPFQVIEGKGFKRLMKELAPGYKIPSVKYIKKRLAEKFESCSTKFKELLCSVNSLCLTTDIWTETMSEKSYLGVTVHFFKDTKAINLNLAVKELKLSHTSDYISEVLGGICEEWGIKASAIQCIVTDNGANIVAAAKRFAGERSQLPCFAHTLNLVLETATDHDSIKEIIKKVREIVKWVKNSVNISDKLREIQVNSGIAEGAVKKLILDVKTRWNSTYYMLERFIEMLKIVSEILLEKTTGPEMLTSTEIDVIKQLISLFKPFEFATREVSGENFVTISKVVPIVSCLVSQLDKFKTSSVAVEQVLDCVKKEVQKRFGAIEYNNHAAVATLLDPRFKNLHFRDPVACTKAIKKLRDLIKLEASVSTSSESDEGMAASSSQAYDFWQHHKELAHWQKKKKSSRGSEGDELSVYLGNPVAPLKSNPLEQWDEMKSVFPLLYKQAKNVLVVVASSVPCERLFSKAGATVTKTRNRLSGKHLEKLLFLGGLDDEEFFQGEW